MEEEDTEFEDNVKEESKLQRLFLGTIAAEAAEIERELKDVMARAVAIAKHLASSH